MKSFFYIILFFTNFILLSQTDNPKYNDSLAQQLGADEFGMKTYYFVLLQSGRKETTDDPFVQECFKGHLNNINRLVKENKIIIAGPFGKNDIDFRGLFIFNNCTSVKEVEELLETDPAIKNGFLKPTIIPWYGSAALPTYLQFDEQIWKKQP